MSETVFWQDDEYIVRPAVNLGESRATFWAFMQKLGWNRCYYDFETYLEPSRGCGMILCIEKASNKPVGQVAAIVNANSTGWVSMFIVDEAHRRKGLGRHLFRAVEADMANKNVEIIGLDAVVEQRQTYERRTFEATTLGHVKIMVRDLHEKASVPSVSVGNLVDIRQVPRELLVASDLKCTGFERPALWSDAHLFNRPDVSGFALIANGFPQKVDDILAWTVVRRCSGGYRIGPVYAQDRASASSILAAAMKSVKVSGIQRVPLPNEAMNEWSEDQIRDKASLSVEVWTGNPEAVSVFEDLGWKDAGVMYYRMWTNGKATSEQSEGGTAQSSVFAIFDAAVG